MNETPLLNLNTLRKWLGDFEIGKGRPYTSAVFGCVRAGDTIKASVKGTRTRPYRVWMRLGSGSIEAAHCTCPVGGEGKCKHVAAVFLAYLESPKRFVAVDDIDTNLTARSKPELVALVKMLLHRSPELEPLLALPLPGFSPSEPDAVSYYLMALERVRAANPHNDWAPHEIASDLVELVEYASGFGKNGEVSNEVYLAISQVLREELGDSRRKEVVEALPVAIRTRLNLDDRPDEVAKPPF